MRREMCEFPHDSRTPHPSLRSRWSQKASAVAKPRLAIAGSTHHARRSSANLSLRVAAMAPKVSKDPLTETIGVKAASLCASAAAAALAMARIMPKPAVFDGPQEKKRATGSGSHGTIFSCRRRADIRE